MYKYVILGPQGSGKGTQARKLAEDYDLVHISVGDIFRWHLRNHTKLGSRVERIIQQGLLVPDEIVQEVVRKRLEEHDWNYGFILDGFPRTRPQAEFLFENWNIDRAIYLDVPEPVIFQRVMHRAQVGEADGSGKRADDDPDILRTRLQEYYEKTTPLLALFEERGILLRIDGTGTIEEVYAAIRRALNLPDPPRPLRDA